MPSALALISLGLGDIDETFRWFDRAIDERDPHVIPVQCYPVLGPIRTDPRYRVLLAKLNMTESAPLTVRGGTATGTGLNTHPEFAQRVRALLADASRLPIAAPLDHFEAQANRDALIETSGALKVVAASLTKIANDIRWMGSGPRAGLGELILPELQKGSSIMPGKVNPVICEVVTQVAAQVIGNDTAITIGGMSGAFELNVYIPLMARNLLESIELLAAASRLLARKLVDGVEADIERNEEHGEATLAMATALNPFIGYDRASAIVRDATSSGRSLREVARAHGVEESVLDEALDLRKIARGNTG